jgi:hypothetical protein
MDWFTKVDLSLVQKQWEQCSDICNQITNYLHMKETKWIYEIIEQDVVGFYMEYKHLKIHVNPYHCVWIFGNHKTTYCATGSIEFDLDTFASKINDFK